MFSKESLVTKRFIFWKLFYGQLLLIIYTVGLLGAKNWTRLKYVIMKCHDFLFGINRKQGFMDLDISIVYYKVTLWQNVVQLLFFKLTAVSPIECVVHFPFKLVYIFINILIIFLLIDILVFFFFHFFRLLISIFIQMS